MSNSEGLQITRRRTNLSMERLLEAAEAKMEEMQSTIDFMAMALGIDLDEEEEDNGNDGTDQE